MHARSALWVPVIAIAVVVVWVVARGQQPSPIQRFVIQPGMIQPFNDPKLHGGNIVTVTIQAASPVDVSFVPGPQLDPRNATEVVTHGRCLQQNVLQTTIQCQLPSRFPQWLLAIKDNRTPAGALGSAAAAAIGIRKPAENYLVRNDVTLSMESTRCTGNCPQY